MVGLEPPSFGFEYWCPN